jgi:uncharacterized membrane protein
MLQLAADIVHGGDAPAGFGHAFAAEDYIDAWLAVMAPEGWTAAEIAGLKTLFAE